MTKRLCRLLILAIAALSLNTACLSINAPERIDLGGRGDRSHRSDRDRDDRKDRDDDHRDRDNDDDDRYDDDDD